MSLGANSHTQATGNGRAKQLFLKTSWFLSVLLNGVLHGLAALNLRVFGKQSSTEPAVLTDSLESL